MQQAKINENTINELRSSAMIYRLALKKTFFSFKQYQKQELKTSYNLENTRLFQW